MMWSMRSALALCCLRQCEHELVHCVRDLQPCVFYMCPCSYTPDLNECLLNRVVMTWQGQETVLRVEQHIIILTIYLPNCILCTVYLCVYSLCGKDSKKSKWILYSDRNFSGFCPVGIKYRCKQFKHFQVWSLKPVFLWTVFFSPDFHLLSSSSLVFSAQIPFSLQELHSALLYKKHQVSPA